MSGARPNSWMPIYWSDYLADTSHLGAMEHGAYLLLIAHYWQAGKPLPDDDVQLSRIARVSRRQWKTLKPLLAAFFEIRDGTWQHGRVERELQLARERYERRAAAGQKGGRTRKPGASDAAALPEQCDSNASAMRKQPQPQRTYSSSEQHPSPPSARPNGGSPDVALGNRLLEIVGIDPARWTGTFGPVQVWLNAGYDPETIIVPTIRDVMRRQRTSKGEGWRPNSLQFFHRAVEEAASRPAPKPAETPKSRIDPHVRKWPPERWYNAYTAQDEVGGGVWPDEWGPPPGAEGHLGPGKPAAETGAGERQSKPNSRVPATT